MPDLSADLNAETPRQRVPTKLECGLFGALSATIVLSFLFWLGIEFSFLKLVIQLS